MNEYFQIREVCPQYSLLVQAVMYHNTVGNPTMRDDGEPVLPICYCGMGYQMAWGASLRDIGNSLKIM